MAMAKPRHTAASAPAMGRPAEAKMFMKISKSLIYSNRLLVLI
jgi:hypothetical protein